MDLMNNAVARLRAELEAIPGILLEDVSDEELLDVVQSLERELVVGAGASTANAVDTAIVQSSDVPIAPDDGVMLLVFRKADKVLIPRVVQLGLMTESRVEAALGTIYAELNKARVAAYQQMVKDGVV